MTTTMWCGRAVCLLVLAMALATPPCAAEAPDDGEGFAQAPIRLDAGQRQAIGVTFGQVERRPVEKVVRTVGRFDYDERAVAEVTLKVSGYIEDLYVGFTGQAVKKGDRLFSLYSPDLLTAEQEYLLSRENAAGLAHSELPGARTSAESLLRASRERLRLWDVSEAELRTLERTGKATVHQTIYSPISGVVVEKMAFKGHAVAPGMTLYKIADLSTVWLYADVYEYELPYVRAGQEARITLAYYPDAAFTARVAYVYPTVDPKTRTTRVRFELANSADHVLRPEMYGDVELRVPLGERLVVPATAVLDTGRRQVVFLDGGNGRLVPRDVALGGRFDGSMEVRDGLVEGDRVVTSGNFLVDSESKLEAAESMMGMMGAIGMGDWKMESAKPMEMGGEGGRPEAPSPSLQGGPPQSVPEKRVGDLLISVAPVAEPTTRGETPLRIRVRDAEGQPVVGAGVSFTYTMDMPGMSIEAASARDVGNGTYEGAAKFTMGGPWGVVVQIERPGKPPLREKFLIRVGG